MTKETAVKLVLKHPGFNAEFIGEVLHIKGNGQGNLTVTINEIRQYYGVILNKNFKFEKL